MEEIAERNPAIRRALSIEELIKKDDNERRLYLLQEKARMEQESSLEGAEARGEAKGEAKGKAEVARKMLAKGMSIDLVAELTGLSPEELNN